jgi:hypothetical protein
VTKAKQAPVNYGATFAPVEGGRLVMICADEENARPWLNLLRGAGLTLENHGPGRYSFTFAELPEVNLATGDLLRRVNMLPEELRVQVLDVLRGMTGIAERSGAESKTPN